MEAVSPTLDKYTGQKTLDGWKAQLIADLNTTKPELLLFLPALDALVGSKEINKYVKENVTKYANILRDIQTDIQVLKIEKENERNDLVNNYVKNSDSSADINASQLTYQPQAREKITGLNREIADKDAAIAAQQAEVARAKAEVTELTATNQVNADAVQALKGEIEGAGKVVEDITAKQNSLLKAKKRLEAEIETKKGEIATAKDALDELNGKFGQAIGVLETLKGELAATIAEKEAKLTESTTALTAAQAQLAQANAAFDAFKGQLDSLLSGMDGATESFKTSLSQLLTQISSLRTIKFDPIITALNNIKTDSSKEVQTLIEELNKAATEINLKTGIIQTAVEQFQPLINQFAEATSQIARYAEQIEAQNGEINALQEKLASANKAQEDSEDKLRELTAALEKITKESDKIIQKLEAEKVTLNEEVEKLKSKIDEVDRLNTALNAKNSADKDSYAKQIGEKEAQITELLAKLKYQDLLKVKEEDIIPTLKNLLPSVDTPLNAAMIYDLALEQKDIKNKNLLLLLQRFMDLNDLKITKGTREGTLNKFNDVVIHKLLPDTFEGIGLDYLLITRLKESDEKGAFKAETEAKLKEGLYLTRDAKDKLGSTVQAEEKLLDGIESLAGTRVAFYKERNKNPENYQYVRDQLADIEHEYNEAKRLKQEPIQAIGRLLSLIPPQSLKYFLENLSATERSEDDLRKIGPLVTKGGMNGDDNIDKIFNNYLEQLSKKYIDLNDKIGERCLTNTEAADLSNSINTLDAIAEKLEKLTPPSSGGDGDYSDGIYNSLNNLNKANTKFVGIGTKPDNTIELVNINARLSKINNKGSMRGGVEPVELPKDPATINKEKIKTLDELKKSIRELISNAENYNNRFNKFYTNVTAKEVILNGAKQTDEKYTDEKYTTASGLYQYLQDEGKNLNTDIQSKITTDKKALQTVVDKLNALLDQEPPTVKLFRDARFDLKKYMSGVEPNGTEKPENGLESLYPKVVNTIKGYYEEKYANIKTTAEGLKKQREYELESKRADQRQGIVLSANQPQQLQKIEGQPLRGGNGEEIIIQDGIKKITDNLNAILTKILVPISQQYTKRLNPTLLAVTSASPPTLFQSLYNRYLDEVTDDPYRATERLSESLRTNHLVPKDVLEVTRNDRLVFMFTTLIVRLFGVNLTNWLIDRGYITTLRGAFISYLALYSLIMIFFVAIVNLDLYRMRIIFNYVNLHANRSRIITHLLAFWVFAFFVYLYFSAISSINNTSSFTSDAPASLSEEDKARLEYKVQLLSIILWILLIILIALI